MQRWDPSSIWPAPTPDAYESPKAVHSYASARLCSMLLLLLLAPLGTSVAGRAVVATRKEARKRRKVGAIVLNGGEGEGEQKPIAERNKRAAPERESAD